MVASMAMALDWAMGDMVLAMDTERGPLMPSLRLMLGTDMEAFMATDSQSMVDMDMVDTVMERGLLMLRPMPGMDMVDSTAMDSQPMAVMAMDCGERSKPKLPKTSTDHHTQ